MEKPNLLFVGSFFDLKKKKERGGMLTSCNFIAKSVLADHYNIVKCDSTTKSIPIPPLYKRMGYGIIKLIQFIGFVVKFKPKVLIAFCSSNFSFLEKCLYCFIASAVGSKTYLSVRSGVFMTECRKKTCKAFIFKTCLKIPHNIICQGKSWQAFYSATCDLPSSKVHILYNYVELQKISNSFLLKKNRHLNDNKNKIRIIFIGWLQKNKGILELLKAFSQTDTASLSLHVVGGGGLYDHLKERYNFSNVTYTNWISNAKVLELLSNSDVFILPSYNEGLPNSMLEAMSCGVFPIVSNVGSVGDFIEHNCNGYLLDEVSVNSIQESLQYIIKQRSCLVDKGALAKKTVDSTCNTVYFNNQIIKIFNLCLSK